MHSLLFFIPKPNPESTTHSDPKWHAECMLHALAGAPQKQVLAHTLTETRILGFCFSKIGKLPEPCRSCSETRALR